MSKRILFILSLVLIFTLGLTSCGDDETPPAEQPTAALADQPTAAPADQPTAAPADQPTAAPADQPTAAPTPANLPTPDPALVSDLGFRPEVNGFSFPNYGGDAGAQNLTPAEIQRLFGDQVCARKEGDQCILTPPGAQWMEQVNSAMAGGHCEGFAVLSLLLYEGQIKTDALGGGQTTADLTISNPLLQREIALWFTTQAVNPTVSNMIKGTPNDILNVLKQMKPGGETYTIGIYKRDRTGGHAITPFAVEDKGNGIFEILVYDNNYPKDIRRVTVDSNKNTWSYEASINPQVQSVLYEGDADTKTLELTPSSARLPKQACPFCANAGSARAGYSWATEAPQFNEIYLDGMGHLLITDEQGRRLGYADGKLVNEIPGATYNAMKVADSTKDSPEPIYQLPQNMNATVTIDGSTLSAEETSDLVMIGPGFSIGVEGIGLEPNQKDTAIFMPADELMSYDTDSSESPNFVVGVEQPGKADYYFEIQGADMVGGGTVTVALDTKKGVLLINTEKLKNEGKFNLTLTRITEQEEESFTAEDIALKAGAIVYVEYDKWEGNGKGLYLGVDTNGDGTIEDEYAVNDSQ